MGRILSQPYVGVDREKIIDVTTDALHDVMNFACDAIVEVSDICDDQHLSAIAKDYILSHLRRIHERTINGLRDGVQIIHDHVGSNGGR